MAIKYPEHIMKAVRQNLGVGEDDMSMDSDIEAMSKGEVLNRVATWNNLIGYGAIIKRWVEDIYNITLKGD